MSERHNPNQPAGPPQQRLLPPRLWFIIDDDQAPWVEWFSRDYGNLPTELYSTLGLLSWGPRDGHVWQSERREWPTLTFDLPTE